MFEYDCNLFKTRCNDQFQAEKQKRNKDETLLG